MGASKRMMLAKAMKEARGAKAGASSTLAADSVPPPILLVRSDSHLLPSRASIILSVFRPFLSLRWAALYDRERSSANPHARGEAHLVTPYRPRGVSNTEMVLSLILSPRAHA